MTPVTRPLRVDFDRRDVRFGHDLKPPGRLRLRNRRDRGRVLRVDVTAAARCSSRDTRTPERFWYARVVDRRRPGERMPAERARGRRHHVGEAGAAQRRHRILARARALEDVAARDRSCPLMLPACPDTPISYSTLS